MQKYHGAKTMQRKIAGNAQKLIQAVGTAIPCGCDPQSKKETEFLGIESEKESHNKTTLIGICNAKFETFDFGYAIKNQ